MIMSLSDTIKGIITYVFGETDESRLIHQAFEVGDFQIFRIHAADRAMCPAHVLHEWDN